MALLGGQRALGIALTAGSLQLAEIRGSGKRFELVRTASFPLSEQRLLKEPMVAGKELAKFLKTNGFSARQTVVGLSAQCLMFKETVLPKASMEATASMLLIKAEREFSLDPASLSLDFLAGADAEGGQRIVLAAAIRERIEQIRQLARAAGLNLRSITASALAISNASGHPNILYFGDNGAESVETGSQGIRRMRYVSSGSTMKLGANKDTAGTMVGELRRAIALARPEVNSAKLTIWDDVGVDQAVVEGLQTSERAVEMHGEFYDSVSVNGASPEHSAASTALALCAANPRLSGIDFIHSRMAPKAPSKFTSGRIWSTVAAVVVLSGLAFLVLDWQEKAAEVAGLRQKLEGMKNDVKAATDFVSRYKKTSMWYDKRPNYLECLRAITLTLPGEGRVWASSIAVRDDLQGVLTGRALDNKSVTDFSEKLKSNHSFANVIILSIGKSDGQTSEVPFIISFSFHGVE